MPQNNKKLYDNFDRRVSGLIVHAKAASINAQIDCIYPESFMVAILVTGANEVNSCLVNMEVDLDAMLDVFKKELIKHKTKNEVKGEINCQDLKISSDVVNILKKANDIKDDILPLNSGKVGMRHVFISILRNNKRIRDLCARKNISEDGFVEAFQDSASKEDGGLASAGDVAKSKKLKNALKEFCVNVTEKAKENFYDPILAREAEIEKCITILCRRGKNNPILMGEPGVGKTAIVEGIAQRIVSGTVPKKLLNNQIYSLSLASVVAGTKYRGEFEERIDALIKDIQSSPDSILFIDEIHTLIGAGSSSGGTLDASNILKPFLARSDLKCIGATTNEDYKKYFQKDGALERRFQPIVVEEPDKEQMLQIINGIKNKYEDFHDCVITDDAVEAIINLSERYLTDRNFPDKAIDCMDMCCATESVGRDTNVVNTISYKNVAKVISEQCGIPIEVIMWDNNERIMQVEEKLKEKIVGQDVAISAVCNCLKNAYSGIRNPDKPIGGFVFGGNSGTGKTYMAKELAKIIFGKENSFIRLDMSEYSEPHSVSKLVGSPPGYVGFRESDVLVDKIKRKPYSIVLLDELEKAHPNVIRLFLQVLSDGKMTDSNGKQANFKNAILIMTGNFGFSNKDKQQIGFSQNKELDVFHQGQNKIINFCKAKYGNEFINRIDEFIPFFPLSDDSLKKIAEMRYNEIESRLSDRKIKLKVEPGVTNHLLTQSKRGHGGNATALNRTISKVVEFCISDVIMGIPSSDDNRYMITLAESGDEIKARKRKLTSK